MFILAKLPVEDRLELAQKERVEGKPNSPAKKRIWQKLQRKAEGVSAGNSYKMRLKPHQE